MPPALLDDRRGLPHTVAMRGILTALVLLTALACGPAQGHDASVTALERLAERGNAEAAYYLGMAYQTGTGAPVDHAQALTYFRRAAAAGEPLAAYKLGCFYTGQDDVLPVDLAQALHYKLVAAEAGYALAQQDVAAMHHTRGDRKETSDWLTKAAAQGTGGALMAYTSLHNSDDYPRKPAVTAAYFQLFVDRTDGNSTQRAWLATFRSGMTDVERTQADTIVRDYRAAPTPLTIRALLGVRAAEALVEAGK